MRFLIIGNQAETYALALIIKKFSFSEKVYSITTTDSVKSITENVNIDEMNFPLIKDFCLNEKIDTVIVNSENALLKGLVDFLNRYGIKTFGTKSQVSLIFASKQLFKEFLVRNYIPTPEFKMIYGLEEAKEYVRKIEKWPVVIKQLSKSKMKTIVCYSENDALSSVEDIFNNSNTNSRLMIEEFVEGEEFFLPVFIDGTRYISLSPVKYLRENEFYYYSFYPFILDTVVMEEIEQEIIWRFMEALIAEKLDYRGIAAFRLKLTENGVKLISMKINFSTPYAQIILPLISNLNDLINGVICGNFENISLNYRFKSAFCVNLYSKSSKKSLIKGIENLDGNVEVFYGDMVREGNSYYVNGSDVMSVLFTGDNINQLKEKALKEIKKINFEDMERKLDFD